VARDETVSAFLDRCSELEPTDRLLVLHCGIEGWNCADVARRLDLSHEAIRKRWQRLRQKLTALPGARELLVG
jgi:DNA-directed RNA polymerase specialized sigma24 family protein